MSELSLEEREMSYRCEGTARMRLMAIATLAFIITMGVAASASAASPKWTVTAVASPTHIRAGDMSGDTSYIVTLTNTGDAPTDGSPIVVTDELPAQLTVDPAGASGTDELNAFEDRSGPHVHCSLRTCTYEGVVEPDDGVVLDIPVDVAAGAEGVLDNVVRVSGGGASIASVETPTEVSEAPAGFGIAPGGAATALSSNQAGSHPDLTTTVSFNTVAGDALAGDPKNTTDDLPAGFAGDLVDTPTCSPAKFLASECAVGTQVGIVTLKLTEKGALHGVFMEPVYNLQPAPGDVARLGFSFGNQFYYEGDVVVRPADYGLETTFFNAAEGLVELEKVTLTIWGVPASPIHDALRLVRTVSNPGGVLGGTSDATQVPFFTAPTACTLMPLSARISSNSWESPGTSTSAPMPIEPFSGCDRLGIEPALSIQATTDHAGSASGLNLELGIPQTYENPTGLATSTLKRAVVTLPEGMTVNPSAGAGLGVCTPEQFAAEGVAPEPGVGCPSEAKLGTVTIKTPSLNEEANGTVFIAQPFNNPFNSLLALYVVARIPDRGVLVKAAGRVELDPVTGRIVTTFDGLPPLPFSHLTFNFRQGATSPLVTPDTCGAFATAAALTPWSAEPFSRAVEPVIAPMVISAGVEGDGCPSGLAPFSPGVTAGTLNNRAGAFSPMYVRVSRNDGEQEITRFSAHLPSGLTADLTGVPFCSESAIEHARANSGTQEEQSPSCPASTQIGRTLVGAGVGSTLAWTPGKLYMAGPYKGAPFSIVAVTPAKVGPFDLGTVVVREALEIDPTTAEVTVDAHASDPIPHILQGVVVHVRDIRVYVDRATFTLNPTNCTAMHFLAVVGGAGASFGSTGDDSTASVEDRFQAANCEALGFRPKFKAATSGKASRVNGTSLHVSLAYPTAPQGTQANIRSVRVELPKQLPSRLGTLQKACLHTTFEGNPEACPSASRVGTARAVTPILPVPLVGTAYFVSYGGAKFPELVIVLRGYGVTIELHGETQIKNGITSSTFRAVPDQPVTSFELTLPAGPYSALAAYGDLCRRTTTVTVTRRVVRKVHGKRVRVVQRRRRKVPSPLVMPTQFTAQNGAVFKQKTPITVSGCAKAKK